MRVFALALTIVLLAAACTTGDSGRSEENYFAELGPVMRAYHDELASQRATRAGMDAQRLSAAYSAYGEVLERFAGDVEEISPANKSADAQHEMVVATRALAAIYDDRSEALMRTGATPEATPDFDGREERRSSEWFDACHDLQDLALVNEIDVDLLCVTMLGSNTESRE